MCCEPVSQLSLLTRDKLRGAGDCGIPFHRNNAIRSEFQDKQSAISNEPKIGRGRHGQAVIEEGRVLDRRAVVALRAETQHDLRD